jgi:putative beta-barrel porin BBP2
MRTRWELARAVGFLAALGTPCAAGAVQFDYHIEAGLEHNDNVTLSETDPVSADILEPKFAFNLSQQGSTVQANASGVLEYYEYLGGELASQFRSQLAAHVNWTMIPERLDFTFEDALGLEPINALEANTQTNLQQTNVFGLGPTLSFRMGDTVRGQAELRYITSHAEETGDFNSNRAAAALRAIKDLDSASAVSANLDYQHVDFTDSDAIEPDYGRYSVFGRYARKWTKLDFTADAGWNWVSFKDNAVGDRDEPLARVNADWHVTTRSTFSGSFAYQYSDTASDMLTGMVFTGTVPGSITEGVAVGTSQAYLERAFSVGYAYAGDRASVAVRPYYRKLDYLQLPTAPDLLGANQAARGAIGSFSWILRPLLTASLGGTWDKTHYETVDREDTTWTATAALQQQWSRNWSGQISYTHYDRNSDVAAASNDQNVVYVAVTYTR